MKRLLATTSFALIYQVAFAITIYVILGAGEFFGANNRYPEMNNPENMTPLINYFGSCIMGIGYYLGFKKFKDKESSLMSGAKFGLFVSIFAEITNRIFLEGFNDMFINNYIAALESLIWVSHHVIFGVATAFIFQKIKE